MSMKRKSRGGRPSRFTSEFRRDAVALVLDEHRRIADVARSVGVNEGTWGTGSAWSASSAGNARG